VLAAGAICWRQEPDGELEVLLVRSARWGDWSWPKGKLDPGETLPECAVREVLEETGVQVELGVPLPSVSYVLPDGQDKTVHYWAARSRGSRPRTATEEEIAEVSWLSTRAARERLSRPSDFAPLDELLSLAARTRLDTHPVLVLRHAKARSRANWPGEEADRPLTGSGRRQANGVSGLIACWAPERILTSPWARCRQTLQPYLEQDGSDGVHPEVVPLLSEQGLRNNPDRISETVAELLVGGRSALLCTHRPVLAVVVDALAEATALAVRDQLPHHDPWLSPAEVLVVQVSGRIRGHRVMHRVHSVERYRPEVVRKPSS
jgi:8-oxo-dGTP pyrophosphatase MutT (NUDIX family)/phosphohistidine phosphatase SixA